MTHSRVRYRPVPAIRLPYGPVSAYVGLRSITWAIDDAQMDPILGNALADVSEVMLGIIPSLRPQRVRVIRDHRIGGSDLIVAELTATAIDVRVPYELVTHEVAQQVSLHGTDVVRAIVQGAVMLNRRQPSPPAA